MPSLPDLPSFEGMCEEDGVDLWALMCAGHGTGIVAGGLVTPGVGMSVNVSAAVVKIQGARYLFAGVSNLAVNAANTGDRRDTVILRLASGVVTAVVVAGTPSTYTGGNWTVGLDPAVWQAPQKAHVNWQSANDSAGFVNVDTDCPLEEVYVASSNGSNTTSISSTTPTGTPAGNLVEKRSVISNFQPILQSLAEGQDATGHSGNLGAASVLNSLPIVGQVGAASIGVAVSGLTTITLAPGPNQFPSTNGPVFGGGVGGITVPTTTGTAIFFTGGNAGNVLTGLTLFGGTGNIVAGNVTTFQSFAMPAIDVVAGDWIAMGVGGKFGSTDWSSVLCQMENLEAGLTAPGQGFIMPYGGTGNPFYGNFGWSGNDYVQSSANTGASSPSGGPYTLTYTTTLPSGVVTGMTCQGPGITGTATVSVSGLVVTLTGTIATGGLIVGGTYTYGYQATTGSPTPSATTSATIPSGISLSDTSQTFRRAIVYWLVQPNGQKIAIATTGTVKTLAAIDTHVQTASVTLGTTNQVTVASGGFPGSAVGDTVTVYSGTGTIPANTTILSISGNTMTLSAVTTAGTATIAYQGYRSWDSGDLGGITGTGVTVTASAHSVGTGAANLTIVGLTYMNGSMTGGGSIMNVLAQSGSSSSQWAPSGSTGLYNWVQMLTNNGSPPRRVILCFGAVDAFTSQGGTPTTLAANLTACVQAIQAISGLIEIVLVAEYAVGGAVIGDTTVAAAVWGGSWVPAIRQVAAANGCTFVDMWARYGNCTSHRQVTDLVTTAGSPTVTSATASFTAEDNGNFISCPGLLPFGTTLTYVNSTTATASTNAAFSATAVQATIGGDPYGMTIDNGLHFGVPSGVATSATSNSASNRNGQRAHAELFWKKLGYSQAQGAGGASSPTFQNLTLAGNETVAGTLGVTGLALFGPFGLPITAISVPGATPTINASISSHIALTGIATAITNMSTNLTTPASTFNGQLLILDMNDNGTSYPITWGSSFAAGTGIGQALPTCTAGVAGVSSALFIWTGAVFRCIFSWATPKGTLLAEADNTGSHTYSIASSTMAAIDTTNMTTGSFVATSTQVVVELTASNVFNGAGTGNQVWCLVTHSTLTQVGYHVFAHSATTVAINDIGAPVTQKILVTGLTPGTAYNFDWAWGATAGTANINTGGATSGVAATTDYGSAHMRVYAA